MSASDPVLEHDARDALVMAPVPGDDNRPVGYCDGANEEIGIREALSTLFEHGLGLAKDLCGCLVESKNRQGGEATLR